MRQLLLLPAFFGSAALQAQTVRGTKAPAGRPLAAVTIALLRVNVAYRFGRNTVKAARNRKTLLDEENKRLQSSN